MIKQAWRGRAFAKINITLRVLASRDDGFHELRTVFQSLALHDTLIVEPAAGPLQIICSDPDCPSDERNLVWRAADALARHARIRRAFADMRIHIRKRIPLEAGLGGGSSDAAAALRLLTRAWQLKPRLDELRAIAASLGADVPFFLDGGTALGVGRGDVLFPLPDVPAMWVVLVVPPFGVSTHDAYTWWDEDVDRSVQERSRPVDRGGLADAFALPADELRNDLEPAVARHYPELGHIVRGLTRAGAAYAAMSGSGSAVFGLFRQRAAAAAFVARSARTGRRVILTRTLARADYGELANSW